MEEIIVKRIVSNFCLFKFLVVGGGGGGGECLVIIFGR